jgi:hypothetical protein
MPLIKKKNRLSVTNPQVLFYELSNLNFMAIKRIHVIGETDTLRLFKLKKKELLPEVLKFQTSRLRLLVATSTKSFKGLQYLAVLQTKNTCTNKPLPK